MAKAIALWVRSPDGQGCQYRGVFSQKKKLQEAIVVACGFKKKGTPEEVIAEECDISEDFTEKVISYTYAGMCKQIKITGRIFLIDKDGDPILQAIESEMNDVRNWDVGSDGELVSNPAGG